MRVTGKLGKIMSRSHPSTQLVTNELGKRINELQTPHNFLRFLGGEGGGWGGGGGVWELPFTVTHKKEKNKKRRGGRLGVSVSIGQLCEYALCFFS